MGEEGLIMGCGEHTLDVCNGRPCCDTTNGAASQGAAGHANALGQEPMAGLGHLSGLGALQSGPGAGA